MSVSHRSSEKRRIYHEFRRQEEEVIGSLCRLGSRPISPKTQLEQEKRIRREIANSNERRRMQSINAGFQSLRTLLPHHEGEKLSKAAILQHTSEFIYQLEQDKTRLLSQNCQLKRLLNQFGQDSDASSLDSPLPKRKKAEPVSASESRLESTTSKCWKSQTAESSDEGIGNMSPSSGKETSSGSVDELRREVHDLRLQLERERRLRMLLEDDHTSGGVGGIGGAGVEVLYNDDKGRQVPQHVSYHYEDDDEAFIEEDKTDDNDHQPIDEEDIRSPLAASNDTIEDGPLELSVEIVEEETPQDLSSATVAPGGTISSGTSSGGGSTTPPCSAAVIVEPVLPGGISCLHPQEREVEQDEVGDRDHSTVLHVLTSSTTDYEQQVKQEEDEDENANDALASSCTLITREDGDEDEQQVLQIPEGYHVYQMTTHDQQQTQHVQQQQQHVQQHHHHHQTDQQKQPTRIYPSTSRQNLETIVEAIRHLEGDHMFCDDPEPIACVEVTSTPLLMMEDGRTTIASPEDQEEMLQEEEEQEQTASRVMDDQVQVQQQQRKRPALIPGHEYAIRQQVIHCLSNSMRPGVIVVANHT